MEGRACSENAYEAKRALEASHAVVEIKIKTLDSQVYTCRVEKNVPVPDLKEQIALVTGVPSGSQRLICRGKVLKDEHVLSAYDVEDGHTLHLVTRPAPPPSSPAMSAGVPSEEQDPHALASRNRPGHISHSVLVGTFNIPDRGGVVFPEINRIFSSVLSSLRVGSIFPPSAGTGNGSDSTATVPLNTANHLGDGQEREEIADGRQQERTDHQSTAATDQSGSGDMGPSTDDLFSLRADVGFVGAIPAVSQVRIVQQIVPDALRTVSQYVNRMEQVLAANGQAQTSVSNLDTQSSAFPQQTEQQQSPVSGDGDPAAWASTIRRIQELLSNQAGSELRRLADQLEVESTLQTATARGNILAAGILMEKLGRLLLDLGRTTLTLRRDSLQDEATVITRPPYLVSLQGPDSTRLQPGGGLDSRTEMASQQAVGSMYYLDSDDTPGNMDIHIHAGLPPFLVARPQSDFLSQPTQDGPPFSLSVDGTRVLSDFQNDQAVNGNTTPSMQASLGSMQPPMGLGEHGAVRALPMRTLVTSVPDSSQDRSSLDGASAGRGVFYPLLARFQQLNPASFSHQAGFSLETSGNEERSSLHGDPISGQRQHPSLSILRSMVQDQVGQVGNDEAGSAEREHLLPSTSSHLKTPILEPGVGITSDSVRSTADGLFETNSSNISDVSQNLVLEDLVRPLLYALEAPQTVAGRRDQFESDQLHAINEPARQVDAETSLQLKCSGQTVVEMERSNCASKSGASMHKNNAVPVLPIITHETNSIEMKEIEAVSAGLHSDGFQPFSCRKRACDHLDEQVSTREPLHDFCGGMDEVTTMSTRGTVLQDFLSTLACRRDERSDAELVVEQSPQELSLVLEDVEKHGLCLDSSGLNMVEAMPLSSPRCLAESWGRQGSRDVGLGTLVASAGLDTFQNGTENAVLGNDSLGSVPQNTSRQDGRDGGRKSQQLFPVASHISSGQLLSDSEGALHASHMEDGKAMEDAGLLTTSMDNGRLAQIEQSSPSAAIADRCQRDSGRHIAGASRESSPVIKRQKMQ